MDKIPHLQQIKQDNPHFKGIIKTKLEKYKSVEFPQFVKGCTVYCTGNNWQAYYLWDINTKVWVLGAN